MKVLLAALNAKYIHTSPALRSLRAYADDEEKYTVLKEYTINNRIEFIVSDIYKEKPDYIGFSCYIWNIEMIKVAARRLKKILPNTKSIKFFMVIFPAFFALVNPVSTSANPACIKNTRNAPRQVHTILSSNSTAASELMPPAIRSDKYITFPPLFTASGRCFPSLFHKKRR